VGCERKVEADDDGKATRREAFQNLTRPERALVLAFRAVPSGQPRAQRRRGCWRSRSGLTGILDTPTHFQTSCGNILSRRSLIVLGFRFFF
jgi:hypothetical protein